MLEPVLNFRSYTQPCHCQRQ